MKPHDAPPSLCELIAIAAPGTAFDFVLTALIEDCHLPEALAITLADGLSAALSRRCPAVSYDPDAAQKRRHTMEQAVASAFITKADLAGISRQFGLSQTAIYRAVASSARRTRALTRKP